MEMHVAILSRELQRRGHDVWVAAAPGSPLSAALGGAEVHVWSFPGGRYVAPVQTLRLARWLQRVQPDVIHAHYSRDLWQLVPAMKAVADVPLVFTKHIGTQRPKRDPLHRWLYRRVDYAVAISRVIAQNLLATHPLPAAKVGVIYHGVDVAEFERARERREQVRREFGFGPDHLAIGIMGRLEPHKGHLEFIAMAERVAPVLPEARFLIVGGETVGEEEKAERIRARWRSSPVRDRIVLAGFRSDVPAVLAAMDLFVFPSHAEAFGLVLIEAMAAGLPVVTSNCDGVLDVVEEGVTGWMVPPTDVDGLANHVLAVARDLQLRQKISRAAVEVARFKFSRERMVDEIVSLYTELFGARTTGSPPTD